MSTILVGSAPDSWGVWFPDDPGQTPYTRFLDEVADSGYEWIELGPFGYLPTDPEKLSDELASRNLKLSAGTVFEHLHQDDSWDAVWKQIEDVARLTAAVGGKHVVVIPEMWRDPATGAVLEDRNLTAEQWRKKTDGMNDLGKAMFEKYGVRAQYHPHADSHVDTEENVYRFLDGTDGEFVNLCLDTGHISYCGGDNIAIIERAPDRIGYLHLKQVDPEVRAKVEAEDLPFGEAVRLGAMTEPPRGIPEMPPLLAAIERLGIDVFAIVEQDMYPCEPDAPLPIAKRTRQYLGSCGVPSVKFASSSPGRNMSDLRIAVLGVGMMGADHVARITSRISGARVAVVNDYMTEKAEQIAASVPGARVVGDPLDAIAADDVDAVLLATPGPTHEKQLLACLEHRKPVLCEKPLTTDVETSLEVVRREAELGTAADPGRLYAPLRSGVPAVEGADRRRRTRAAVGDALRAPQSGGSTSVRLRHGGQGLPGARGRRDPLPFRRGDRVGADHQAHAESGCAATDSRTRRSPSSETASRPACRRRGVRHDRRRL